MEGRGTARRLPIAHLLLASALAPIAHVAPLVLLACADARGPGASAPVLPPGSASAASQDVNAEELRVIKVDRLGGGGLVLSFSRAVAPDSLALGRTVHAFRDADLDAGGVFHPLDGALTLDATGRVLTFTPADPVPGREVRLILGAGVEAAGASGEGLAGGAGSAALSFAEEFPDGRFEARTRPSRELAPAATAAAGAGGAADDHRDGPAGATPLVAGIPARGRIDAPGDRDWFRLELRAGEALTLRTRTSGDTTLGLWAPDGRTLLAHNDDDPAGGLHSRIEHRATTDGLHLIEVAGYGSGTPEYGVEAAVVGTTTATTTSAAPRPDDHGDDPTRATALVPGVSVNGRVEAAGDRDWFAIDLAPGVTIELTTTTTGDTVLTAWDLDGTTRLGWNDDDPQGGRDSRLRLSSGAGGTYFVEVAGYSTSTPEYALAATPVAPDAQPDPDRFRLHPGTDHWLIDFEARRTEWERDLRTHGLRAGDPGTDALLEARVIEQLLAHTARKYEGSEDGAATPRGFRISLTRNRPAGTPGRAFSREAVGGRHAESDTTLGVSWLDPGNRRKEDNATPGELGIFSAVIWGRASLLDPPLTAADRRYLDGSYALGDGTAADDRRFRRVRDVVGDWSHALSVVVAHEIGHSVGLDHDETEAGSIMHPTLSRWVLSDRSTRFSAGSIATLEQSLGRHPGGTP